MRLLIQSAVTSFVLLGLFGAAIAQEASRSSGGAQTATSTTGTSTTTASSGPTSTTHSTATGTSGTTATTGTNDSTTIGADDLYKRARDLIAEAQSTPSPTTVKCSWATLTCSASNLYVNGDAISVVHIADLERFNGRVFVTAGESFNDPVLSVDDKQFNPLPSDVTVAIHVNRTFLPTFTSARHGFVSTSRAMREIYSFDRLQRLLDAVASPQQGATLTPAEMQQRTLLQTEVTAAKAADGDYLSLVTAGQSPLLLVRVDAFTDHGTVSKTFPLTLVYQRWYFDTGGFFAFTKARDEELVTESAPDNQVKILQRRRHGNAGTATGIGFNVHAGNYPELGLQFGLVHNNDRAPSYFLGATGRLRSIGRTALMSFSAGIAEVEVQTFPGIAVGGLYPSDHVLIHGQTRYTAKPYISIGVGISLSTVSQGTATTPSPSVTTTTATNH